MAYIGLSRRAVHDLEDVERFSRDRGAKKVADEYLDDIEAALRRLKENPNLLRAKPKISAHFSFYRVRQHWLVCVRVDESTYVVAIRHAAMDLPNRIAELEPHLLGEAELLHRAFRAAKEKRRSS